jgi:hypothetical protein
MTTRIERLVVREDRNPMYDDKCRGFSPFGISYYALCFGGAIPIFAITVY